MSAFYNENDPKTAAWLRELIAGGHIAHGVVDERSIVDIKPHELTGFTQQHFFAGVGGWSLALRLAGWPDDKPVRTGSCPCQPFSIAGNGLGEADERHLWPNFRDLITFGEPTITFGEQVASPDGRDWLAGIRADLEGIGYEVGSADLCAAGVAAPHPRQRLYWVANPYGWNPRKERKQRSRQHGQQPEDTRDLQAGRLGYPDSAGSLERRQAAKTNGHGNSAEPASGDGADGLAHANVEGRRQIGRDVAGHPEKDQGQTGDRNSNAGASFWGNFDVLPFRDGKFRRVEAGTFPLAHGVSGRVGLLRGYGNAIVPQVAAEFIQAFIEATT